MLLELEPHDGATLVIFSLQAAPGDYCLRVSVFSRDGVFPCSFHLTWFHQSEIAQFQDEIRASHFPTPPDQLPRYALLLRM
jgi:hypothetical protein